MSKDTPKGFTCACGDEVKYPPYLYAHWRELMDYTCPKCGAKYTIVCGAATLKKKGREARIKKR